MNNSPLQTDDIQGIIISGYGRLDLSCYLFLEIKDAVKARQWLATVVQKVTTAAIKRPECAVNLALTAPGLQAIGLPKESLGSFSEEFRQGMAEPSRSRRLGDNDGSHPTLWEIGGAQGRGVQQEQVHALLILQAPSHDVLARYRTECEPPMAQYGINVVWAEEGYRHQNQKEHFGFRDSISQPFIEGSPVKPVDAQLPIKAGEFILGYPNSYGHFPPTPTAPLGYDANGNLRPVPHDPSDPATEELRDLGRNGSYLVFRKLYQDVALFRRFFQERFPDGQQRDWVMAKVVGRWPSGAPLVLAPEHDDLRVAGLPQSNNFGFAETDRYGYACPVGAHIRRANPRDSLGSEPHESLTNVNRHRILRRGASYGPPLPENQSQDDGQPRGLLFLCINTDIKRQFEFLQQTWIDNRKFGGLYDDRDPLIGDNLELGTDDPYPRNLTIPRLPVRLRVKDLPRFVTVKGGGYFFLPGIAALRFLAALR